MKNLSICDYFVRDKYNNYDFSKYSILSMKIKYDNESDCNSIRYELKSFNNDVTYSSISILLYNENDIKKAINDYEILIEKIDKFVPHDLYDQMRDIIDNNCNKEIVERYELFEKLNDELNDNINAIFTERINNSILLEIKGTSIKLKISSYDDMIIELNSNFDLICEDQSYLTFRFIEVLMNTKKIFTEIINQLKGLLYIKTEEEKNNWPKL